MSRSYVATGATAATFVVVLALTLAARAGADGPVSTSPVKGPPWVSVEYPANPHDPATRGALVVLHSYHHALQIETAATASAISLVNDQRRTVPLEIAPTSRDGVYAVRGELPEGVASVLVLTTGEGGDHGAAASALVAVGGDHDVLAVRVPHDAREGGQWLVPREPTEREIESLLRTAVALDGAAKATNVASAPTSN